MSAVVCDARVTNDVKEMTLPEIERFIGSNTWTFAKTMPQHPHWYVVRAKCNDEEAFKGFVMHIRKFGYKKKFFKTQYTYFDVGEYTYWTMGCPLNITDRGVLKAHTIILNRAKIDADSVHIPSQLCK